MTFDRTENLKVKPYELFATERMVTSLTYTDVNLQINQFPKTRYYGSKRRLLEWIYDSLKDLSFDTALDGFGGTASVSLLLKRMGKEVTFHDGLLCNTISAYAMLSNQILFSDINEPNFFIDKISPRNGFISKTFTGMYYTNEENQWLDGAASAINKIIDPTKRSVYLYCLFQACLKKRPFNLFHRANLNLRQNRDVLRTFGNHVTWETPFPDLMKKSLLDIVGAVKPSARSAKILEPGDISRLDTGYDLIYLDPPYVGNSKSSEDYLMRYHFLEGFSNYPIWGREINKSSPINALKSRAYMSEWQNKSMFREKLFDLIHAHRHSIVVLSYLAGAYPSMEEITAHFKKNFRSVRVLKKDLNHAMAKETKVELLFIGSNI